jgi:DNA modification methylase
MNAKILNQSYELVTIDKLQPHPENPRRGSLPAIAASVAANGFYGAVVAQRSTGRILVGNHRWEAAKSEGLKEIAVVWVDVSDEEARRILLSDNRTADQATWDVPDLAKLLTEIEASAGLEGTGFDQAAYDAVLQAANDLLETATSVVEDEPPPPDQAAALQKKWKTEPGQIWEIPSLTLEGKAHRLMCGDSTDAADVERLMGGVKADMGFLDPPYGVDYQGYTADRLKIVGDNLPADKFHAFLAAAFVTCRSAIKSVAGLYVCHASSWQREFQNALEGAGFEVRCQIIWAKNTFAWGFGRYKFQHEPIFYAHVAGAVDSWYGDLSQSTLWQESKPAANRLHPTMKPLEIVARALTNSSRKGDLVLDLFGGSGSTMVACEQKSRASSTMEIDPAYCAVILERVSLAGLKPRLCKKK